MVLNLFDGCQSMSKDVIQMSILHQDVQQGFVTVLKPSDKQLTMQCFVEGPYCSKVEYTGCQVISQDVIQMLMLHQDVQQRFVAVFKPWATMQCFGE